MEEVTRRSRGIALDGEYWCEVLHRQLIVIPVGIAKERGLISETWASVFRLRHYPVGPFYMLYNFPHVCSG